MSGGDRFAGRPPVVCPASLRPDDGPGRHERHLEGLEKTNPAATSDDVARLIAQWAVNVVAYRDHNSIMIPFPYDPNPFSGKARLEPRPIPPCTRSGVASGPNC